MPTRLSRRVCGIIALLNRSLTAPGPESAHQKSIAVVGNFVFGYFGPSNPREDRNRKPFTSRNNGYPAAMRSHAPDMGSLRPADMKVDW
jgi:hypothetical protein